MQRARLNLTNVGFVSAGIVDCAARDLTPKAALVAPFSFLSLVVLACLVVEVVVPVSIKNVPARCLATLVGVHLLPGHSGIKCLPS